MKVLAWIALILIAVPGALLVAGQTGLLAGRAPSDLGVRDGRLKAPALTPNSVSSQAALYPEHPQRIYAQIDPLRYTGDGPAALQKLARLLQSTERTVLVKQEPNYLHAECSTAWLKFTDDLEFYLDEPQQLIHVRSASRLGQRDFGVNRERVETLRRLFAR